MKRSMKRERATLKSLEKAAQMRKRPNNSKWFYSFVPFKISTGGTAPLIPLLTLAVGGGPSEVGVVTAVGSSFSMLGGLFWGKLSDKLNRRKVFLIIGFLGSALMTFVFVLNRSVPQVILTNAIYSFFIASTIPIPILIITKSFRFEDWDYAIGKFNEICGWAWVIGLMIGFVLSQFLSIREIFIVLGVIGLISVPWGIKVIREVPLHIDRKILGVYFGYVIEKFRYLPNMIIHMPHFSCGKFKIFYLSTFLFWIGGMLYFTQFPVLLKDRGYTASVVYLMSVGNSAISAYMYTRVGMELKTKSCISVLRNALMFRIAGFVILLFALKLSGIKFLLLAFISYFLAGYTWAYIGISTTLVISKNAPEKERGTLIGTYNLISSLGAIIGNLASGILVELFGFETNFSLSILLLGVSVITLRYSGL
ncbi:MFS transporter [Thermococcus sp. M39]|uniref:MFS transporter n=1 Tax=unclassified Thermococcus TaxID=2627626 RepID=UPI0014396FB5|nr:MULTISPECIES: MFS transporter [unclassified Thermococcus]NJE08249.1 MFS transporter [Thermococcus sp. M39]NJE11742.1 MFS transporter [Thermococcus sp. LS2]